MRLLKTVVILFLLGLVSACTVTTSFETSSNIVKLKSTKPDPDSLDPRARYVCDDRKDLHKVLDVIVNRMQFVNNRIGHTMRNKELRKIGCALIRIELGTKFFHTGFYQNDHGFIFSTFEYNDKVFYDKPKKRGQTADAIFESKYWVVKRLRDRYTGRSRSVIEPKECGVLLQHYPTNLEQGIENAPEYIFIPEECHVYSN